MIGNDELEARLAELRRPVQSVSFRAGFADRVMARTQRAAPLADGLAWGFWRLAPLAVAAAVVLAVINLRSGRGAGGTVVDRVLGLPAVTLAAAYDVAIDDELTEVSR